MHGVFRWLCADGKVSDLKLMRSLVGNQTARRQLDIFLAKVDDFDMWGQCPVGMGKEEKLGERGTRCWRSRLKFKTPGNQHSQRQSVFALAYAGWTRHQPRFVETPELCPGKLAKVD